MLALLFLNILAFSACEEDQEVNPILEAELTVQMDTSAIACCGDDPPPCPHCK
ncbi:MAG: hypothetical protein AAGI07_05080 [Bacteroidota bacterium]